MAETVTIRLSQDNCGDDKRSSSPRPSNLVLGGGSDGDFDDGDKDFVHEQNFATGQNYQGPHDWRKRLKPVKSPIKTDDEQDINGDGKENGEEKPKSRPLPPWKRDLIERNKKVARLVRRESSGRRNPVVRRESSGRSKKGSESPSALGRKRSLRNQSGAASAFAQQVVNENVGSRRRISPANSFQSSGSSVRRTPSDKVLDPNDPNTRKLVERVRRARLYLLQQMGPNSFLIVGDSPEHKFKVIIGPQTCSCGRAQHCVHVLFVMLRVFQVQEQEPCLWSKKLKNYEVENLFRMYHDKRTLKIEAKKLRRTTKISLSASHSPSLEETHSPSECDTASVREEDDTCPICLLEMLEGESLLKCEACQNKLHHHCITVWFEECKRQKEPLICPLCRTHWKKVNVEIHGEESSTDPLLAPPNTRAPSPQHENEMVRLPYAEPIPSEHVSLATPWIETLGEDLITCLFSRNWSIRETGLKHLSAEMSRELGALARETKTGCSLANEERRVQLMEVCFKVVTFMCQDPVYKVFVGCLKVLRTVLSLVPSRDYPQRNKIQSLFRPVLDAVIIKCTDGNKRTSELSISTMMEIAKGQNGELALGTNIRNPGQLGLGGMAYLVACLTKKFEPAEVSWQWLLGRLYVVERLVIDFPTEFLPRQRPDGASSESSLELIGAAFNGEEEEKPQNYDRLLIVAEFAIQAVTNQHARISRVAKRVFLLAARYAAHLENLIKEFNNLLNELDFTHKKSLKRQLDKIVADFQLSEQLGRHLHGYKDPSPGDTPNRSPLSSPKCTSPVTTMSEARSECSIAKTNGHHSLVPPNTPIRDRHSHRQTMDDLLSGVGGNNDETVTLQADYGMSKSLDDLDSINTTKKKKPRGTRKSKSPLRKAQGKSRSRSRTPNRIGPVLETDLDEVIKQEEQRLRLNSFGRNMSVDSVYDVNEEDGEDGDLSAFLSPSPTVQALADLHSPTFRLLPHDIETDIDTEEQDIDTLIRTTRGSCDDLLNLGAAEPMEVFQTPRIKLSKMQKPLSLDLHLDGNGKKDHHKYKRSMSPSAHVYEIQRLSAKENASETPCQNSISQSNKSIIACSSEKSIPAKNTNREIKNDKNGPHAKLTDTSRQTSVCSEKVSYKKTNRKSDSMDDLVDYMASTPCSGTERPVTFKTEVAMATPKHSPSQTLDKDDDECLCKEEVEKEEALALAKAMEVSAHDPPTPIVPGLTPHDQEQVITIRIQPDACEEVDSEVGNAPSLYYESVHWVKGPLLGTGAFSTCYQARDVKTGTIMALKQISFCRNSRSEQEKVVEGITEEIHMMAKLSHPHIVRILGATRQGCHFNMFVEWMPGGSVAYVLSTYGKFSEDVMTSYMLQVLRGIAYLHDNHILHRDLKGANLLVDSTGQRVRLGDFGSAARLASKATGAGEFQGQLLGTIAFMAPEVLRGENYGRACDVWSVGCCLIEMATTKPPWNANDISNHLALIFKIANAQSTPPIPDGLSPPLRDLLLRCLEPTKEQRPSAKELLIHPLFTQYMQSRV
ncbi:mitogen-activated protein kinase kinase kinase 1-like [Mya arenaria]|uniref:mitogen-activated protein kinase kinase kinase 1-like n=1 Tax=Mya arenaria TaxID=6604 RepID=UPI0022E2A674|nr:mitogen-activated protein kinase kinase kinase 1-like [Mya arenaria]